jgi:hypothetical protein
MRDPKDTDGPGIGAETAAQVTPCAIGERAPEPGGDNPEQTGENTCPRCRGTGRDAGGGACPECGGLGRVIEPVGDA